AVSRYRRAAMGHLKSTAHRRTTTGKSRWALYLLLASGYLPLVSVTPTHPQLLLPSCLPYKNLPTHPPHPTSVSSVSSVVQKSPPPHAATVGNSLILPSSRPRSRSQCARSG